MLPPPTIILVRPQMGENIGAAARVMANFGLSSLILVAPRDGWPNPRATAMAANAGFILEKIRVVASLAEALVGIHDSYAFTARIRDFSKPSYALPQLQQALESHRAATERAEEGPYGWACVFGQENNGLDNDSIAHCNRIIHVETDPHCASMNLAQTIGVCCYEWHRIQQRWERPHMHQMPPPPLTTALPPTAPPASADEVHGAVMHLTALLEAQGYFHSPDSEAGLRRMLHTLFTNHRWSAQEIRTWRGILRHLGRHSGRQ